MKLAYNTVLIATMATVLGGVCKASTVYHFAGPRCAEAEVDVDRAVYRIQASLLPVTAFDAATNDKLNGAKLRSVALMALARHLDLPETSEVTVSDLRATEWSGAQGRVGGAFEVPVAGVRVAPRLQAAESQTAEAAKPGAGTTGPACNSLLLSRKGDYLDTVAQLLEVLGGATTEVAAPGIEAEQLAQVDEAIRSQFGALRHAVDEDALLLTIERADVHAAMAEAQEYLAAQLVDARTVAKHPDAAPAATGGAWK